MLIGLLYIETIFSEDEVYAIEDLSQYLLIHIFEVL